MGELLTTSHYTIRDNEEVHESTVGQLLRDAASDSGDKPALVEVTEAGEPGRRWTFGELLKDAEDLALALSTRFAPGERICVWAPNIPEWVLLEYAAGLAGLTLVTANPAYQPEELTYVLKQSRSVALFLVQGYRGNPMAEIAKTAIAGLDDIREVTDMQDPAAFRARGDRAEALPDVSPDDPVQIQYTSGTTGFPKGAVLHHRGLTNNARFHAQRCGITPGAPWSSAMPLFHTSGCGMAVLGTIQARAPLYLFAIFDPVAHLRLTESEGFAFVGGVPTMLVAMLDVLKSHSFDTSSVETIFSGGSMVAPELVRNATEAFGCPFQTVYGQTECSPLVTQHGVDDSFDDICTTTGKPMPQTEVSIRGIETGEVMPLGEVGEICVRGYTTMLRYNDNPEATADTIREDGWLRTGDLGTLDARGYLRITGRVKDMIIRGGENLFPAEIENVLLEHPDVAEIAVLGLPDEKWGEIVVAAIRPSDEASVNPEVLKAHCREHLAPMKSPVSWYSVESFPVTGSGKIQKFSLQERILSGEVKPI